MLEPNLEKGLDLVRGEASPRTLWPESAHAQAGPQPWLRFLLQFHNPLIYILLAAGAIKLAMGGLVDAAVILSVVLINAVIGYLQEAKAERAIEAFRGASSMETTVLRGGKTARIPSPELVPGDLVLLASGDKVPADLRLVATRDLQIAEAALTGESTCGRKERRLQLAPDTSLADRVNMAYASTPGDLWPGRGAS